jgi:hypothetical protein
MPWKEGLPGLPAAPRFGAVSYPGDYDFAVEAVCTPQNPSTAERIWW